MLPLATLSALQAALPPAASLPSTAVNVVAVETLDPQTSAPETTPHLPLLDASVKPDSDVVAVNVAQVPVVYHVPAEMMQPVLELPTLTFKCPFPLKGVPGVEVLEGVLGLVPLGVEPPPLFGRYLMPVDGQVDFVPSGFVGTKVPVWTLPRTPK